MNKPDSLPEMERELLLNIWNQTAVTYPTDRCLHQLFEEQVTKNGDAIAVECNGETLSYRALNSESNKLAHYLIQQGVRPDTLVGICIGRSTKLVVTILGILKAGGAYVPLDPAYPSQRLTHILQDANPLCLVADSIGREVFGEHVVTVVDIEQVLSSNISDDNIVSSKRGLSPHHLAYVIYTSGSTGLPKGVMIEHRSIVNYAKALSSLSHVGSESRILQFASCSFDASVSEIVMALTNGARLCIPTEEDRETDITLLNYISSSRVTHALLPPALFQNTQNLSELQNLKALLLGGETPAISLVKNAATRTAVFNLYGPTEATIMATFWQCPVNFDGSSISIGRPIANTRIYVLDSDGEPVSIGKDGELYIGGAGVARGYLNRSELTSEYFLPDPFSDQPGARMYRTGDRARYLTDGNLVYLGRIDHQVKIRGYRIEPGEIEARLVEHPLVHEAVVVPRNDGSDTRLVAYVVAEADTSLARDLRTYLALLLPNYMVPVAYVCLSALPVTPNGKLDRRSLPAPDDEAFASQVYEAPQGEMEEKLAGIWRELLGVDRISRHDNFFELGGHSLLVARLLGQLRQDELETSVRAVFETATLAALAKSINRRLQNIITPPNLITTSTTKITPDMLPLISLTQKEIDLVVSKVPGGVTNVKDIYSLTPLQHGILFHHMMAERGDPYLIVTRLQFTERIALDRYASALQLVIERHDVLRTAFVWEDLKEPAQIVWRQVPSILTEISLDDKDGLVLEQLENRFTLDHYKLDLKQASLLRLIVSPASDGSWVALQLMHHIIGDNVTLERLIAEVYTIAEGRHRHLLTPTQFRHVVAQSRLEDASDAHIQFFTEMLADVDSPTLPFGLSDIRRGGTEISEAHLKLPQALVVELRAQARRFRVSLASLCHLAWAQVLACASSCEKVVFGTVVLGRFQAGEEYDSAVGLLINTLPLRLNMDDTTVGVAVRQTHYRLSALLSHEYASLAMAQRCSGIQADVPLFSALLNYRHHQRNETIETSIAGMSILSSEGRTNYPLILSIDDDDEGLHLTAQVSSSVSATRICTYMQEALISMADALQHTPQKSVRSLTVLPSEERDLLLHGWNQTAVTYPTDRCLHQLFEAQVKKNGNAIAVECEGQTLSYTALNARANRLAHHLIKKGVRPDTLVGLCMERSTELVVGILGILKAGGAYVPLDPAYPSQRLKHILQDANPLCLVADATGREVLGEHEVPLIDMEQALSDNQPNINIDPSKLGLTPSHLTYVIYTSGSTGTPKGVMVEHQHVVRLFESTRDQFEFNEHDKWCLFHSYSFDVSVWELWGAFINGCQLSIVPHRTGRSTHEFYKFMCNNGITVLNQTPSAFKSLLQNIGLQFDNLRYVIFAGEQYDPVISKIWNQKHSKFPTKLINLYGTTETTVHATFQQLKTPEDIETVGRPLSDLYVYILDSQGEPVPLGAEGELYIGGSGVTRGYLNRPELTSQRFLTDPFSNRSGDRMYRTGDRARYLPDGKLVYLGRSDQQVKIRGYRIEPGEIEAHLVDHPRVREAVVVPRNDGSDTRLVAYVVAEPDTSLARDLRTYLASLLPDYMIPVAYVCLTALPLTSNGKLDRQSLPAPDDVAFASQVYEAPEGEMEKKLANIWRELLGIDRISRHDNFFELGGHSLLVVRLLGQLRQDALETSVRSVFETPTLAALAKSINRRLQNIITPPNLITTSTTKITPDMLPLISLSQKEIDLIIAQVPGGISNIQDIYSLTPLQHGILFHHMMAEKGDPYLLVTHLHFSERAALDRYASALQKAIERHDVLRTAFVWDGLNEPAQIVWRQVSSLLTEITLDESEGPILEQLTNRFSLDHYKLDLTQAPLMRLIASPMSDGNWVAIQLMQHIIDDNYSLQRLYAEVQTIAKGKINRLATPIPFRHVVAQARMGDDPDAHNRFFTEMLADIDSPTLPFGLTDVRRDGTDACEAQLKLPQALTEKLRAYARRMQVSLASLCHLAWAQVLACASSCEKVVFGTVLLGRFQAGEMGDGAMGLLMNTLPFRLNMDETMIETAVRESHSQLSALLVHEHASLAMAQRCSGIPADMPLFSALLNYRHDQRNGNIETSFPGMTILSDKERTNYPLILMIDDDDYALSLIAQVVSPVSAIQICAYMQQALISMADALQHTPQKSVRSLTVLPSEERDMLLHGWNQTSVTYPTDRCLHQLFEAQVKKNGSAIAVECEGQTLSYTALNARANRLAHHLIKKGVRPDTLVGLCMERSTELVVGILGILKAGGAYVPLDPAYPSQRLFHILQDANPLCLVVDSIGRKVLGELKVPLIDLEQVLSTTMSEENINCSELGLTPSNLTYVIYTSGSTGTPKGVMVEHQQVVRLFESTREKFDFNERDKWCLAHSYSFDFSVWEVWGAFYNGCQLTIVPVKTSRSTLEFYEWICSNGITVLNQTSSAFKTLLEAKNISSTADHLRYVIFGGEEYDPVISKIWNQKYAECPTKLINMYGITETTVHVTFQRLRSLEDAHSIGRPLSDLKVYILDSQGEPVPLGAEGELYIGGSGVTRGYLNRPELTAQRFLTDPFSNRSGDRMYRTGDRARYLPDGKLVYLGRSDQQVKIRGYRIEPGEIEARLVDHPRVREAVVVPRNDGSDTRLVAYVVAEPDPSLARDLRAYLASLLPDYMVPVAYVCLTALPLTSNGKLDRQSLPAPDDMAFASQLYEAPQGEMEMKLRNIWRELLGIDRISRHDNFFELGGHSLLIVRLLSQLRKDKFETSVRAVFDTPTLASLAATLHDHQAIIIPSNVITINTVSITPDMLPLIDLSQADIELVVGHVPYGISNIQDIYALTPLQQGILFHHMVAEKGDPYLIVTSLHFTERISLDRYASALQHVIERHDVLRTAFIWEGLSEPAQVVWRRVPSLLTEITLDENDGSVLEQLENRFSSYHYKPDLTKGSLLRLIASQMSDGSWAAVQLMHHIIGDNESAERLCAEVQHIVKGDFKRLATPIPFRNVVAEARIADDSDAHSGFFSEMLANIDSPTLPFGLTNVRDNDTKISEAHLKLPQALTDKLRAHARRLKISLASMCHLAWAQVLACASGSENVVFGTVLLGRFQTGEEGVGIIGLLINTLPFRLNVDGTTIENAVFQTHTRLSALLTHENASLALAQRCSSIPPDKPLFSALLNYRHNQRNGSIETSVPGMTIISTRERTNYPIILSIVDDIDDYALSLTAQVTSSVSATRICAYMQEALISMADALQHTPQKSVRSLTVLPSEERDLLLHGWNQTAVTYLTDRCLHQLFEAQVKKNGSAIAVECEGQTLSYTALNARANRLAHHLIKKGVRPDTLVGLCMERSTELVVGILGILKAGGAYVPLDPAYPSQRLFHILQDANPLCLVVDSIGRKVLGELKVPLIDLEQVLSTTMSEENINCSELGLTPSNLTYVIYTSGSTGTPKGVMVEHQQVVRLFESTREKFDFNERDKWCLAHSYSFDFSVWEVWGAFYNGCQLTIVPVKTSRSTLEFYEWICSNGITVLNQTSSAFKTLLEAKNISSTADHLRYVIFGGEEYDPVISKIWNQKYAECPTKLINMYGITETTVHVTFQRLRSLEDAHSIGRPLSDLKVYILDSQGEPVPLGAEGELYIGGSGVTRGYLNRPELTAQRFLTDPFSNRSGDRMYRTGDRARYLPDGKLVYLGRSDQQVKIRGYRIEPGEIEARLVDHPRVREAVVVPRNDGSDTRLVAYVVAEPDPSLARDLRAYLASLLPDYMIPVAYVCLTALPLTSNGKLDRQSLPAPDDVAFASQVYEAPEGEMEKKLANIWRELLGIDRISRHDNFFELGGHSLLVVRLLGQLRQDALETSVRSVFETPTLAALAKSINRRLQNIITPPNLITTSTTKITPDMLPLISLSQKEIDLIIAQVPGGISNIQDIYSLTPLQHGILFHHMMAEKGDPYLLVTHLHFSERAALDRYASALQQAIERHDILRTAFVWEGLSEPAQIVWRQVSSLLTEIMFDENDGPILEQLTNHFCLDHYKLDMTQAPLLRLIASPTSDGSWVALQLMHHIIDDNFSLQRLYAEVQTIAKGDMSHLTTPKQFRDVVTQVREGSNSTAHSQFFSEMLADIDSPTLPFGLTNVLQDGSEVNEAHLKLPEALTNKLRAHARRMQISLASLCHLAWAQVLGSTSGCENVVFGTVLFGRFQTGEVSDGAMGPQINTLPLLLKMDDTTVEVALRQAHTKLSSLLTHEHASLALAQRCSSVPADMPLLSALLNYRHNQGDLNIETSLPGVTIISEKERTNYPLILSIDDDINDYTLSLTVQVSSPISATRICAYMQQALISMTDALQHTPQKSVRSLTVLPSEERDLLLHGWNQTAVTYPTDRCIHQLFEAQVKKNGNAIAVECEGQTLSYTALNARANRLAHHLIKKGVRPDTLVGLCMERSTELVVGILGILKAGGAYVPLDPAYPSQRLSDVLQDADPLCLIADSTGQEVLGKHNVPLIDMKQALCGKLSDDNIDPSELGLTPFHLSYVIYTSGSTGKPKGVMVEHKNVTNFLNWTKGAFTIEDLEHTLFSTSVGFDTSVFELFAPLCVGGMIDVVADAMKLTSAQSNISLLNTVPSAVTALLNANALPMSLNAINLAGEALNSRLINRVFANCQISQLSNLYGPTETTIFSTWHKYKPGDAVFETIGRPVANTHIYLLDSQGKPVPFGVEGELYIGGAGVTRGYLNRPELTAERFLPDPFNDQPGARMYRTGDRVRYLPDGNVVYLGRTDHQVKIRGYRIEPGEIEARLVEHPLVHEAVVVPRNDGSDTRLVAYVVAQPDTSLARDLRTYLASLLPDYMIPVAYVCLSAMPITPNGKLDRQSLPAPDDTAFASQLYEAPEGKMEEKLASIWRELLGIERISRHDNFFELGGHSLMVVRLLGQLRQDELETSVRSVFETPTLAALAKSIKRRLQNIITPPNLITTSTTKITPDMLPLISLSQKEIDLIIAQVPGGISNIQDIYSLTPLQHGILFHHMMAEKGDPYLLVTHLHFSERAVLDRYASAVQQVIERHDVLRTSIVWEGLNEPAQIVWRQVSSLLTEITFDESDGPILEQLTNRFSLDHYKLDLTQAPLLRLIASPTSDGSWVALQLMHHIIGDNTTSERLGEEVHAIVEGRRRHLPTPTQFRHVVALSRLDDDLDAHNRFFTEMLSDVDSPTIPFGLSDIRRDGTEIGEANLKLPQALVVELRALGRRFRVSLASLCHLAWAQVLACASRCEKVVFGTVVLGRFQAREGYDSAVGLLINSLPLRLNMDDTTVGVAVRQTHSVLSALLSHEHASLAMVQRCSGIPADVPLFSALLNYRHHQRNENIETSIPGMSVISTEGRTNYPLIMSIDDDDDGLHLTAQVSSSVSATRICAYMQQALISLADALQHTPQKSVRSLTVLPSEERDLLLHGWNQTAVTYPTDRCIHQLFEAQVKKNGNAIAVECEGETLSYAALNARANRLAHHLIKKGVRPDTLVGLCMERSTELVVGILGILKAGGAYVPLDPAYPSQRLKHILEDANPLCLVADSTGREVLGDHKVPLIYMEQAFSGNLSDDDIDPSELGLTPSHLTYVMYTSGSTGKPKGVMIEHTNVTNYIYWTKDVFTIEDLKHTLFSTSINFDRSVFELLTPLSMGGTIHVVANALTLTQTQSNISLLNTVPSAIPAILDSNTLPSSLHTIALGGEPLQARLISRVFKQNQITQLCNLCGPTETTIDSTWHKYKSGDVVFETIGKPIANTRIYLLNPEVQPVPLGAEGELYIGGAGVARGYLNRSELTSECFLPDPFSDQPGARMYRTGDRARYLTDGNLVYLGRVDHQVKIRGYRIEPGEIEARLVEHPLVHEAVVVPRNDGSDTRLVAYVVAEADTSLARDLRTYLALLLPEYMVPVAYVCLSALPITPNGKLDRRSLPAPDDESFASQVYEAPRGEMEEKLAGIWRELLGIDRISRHDNFFELGGHSLLVVRLLGQLRQDELETSVRAVFETRTLAALAVSITRRLHNIITPPNLITASTTKITPDMLPLINLSQKEIDLVVSKVPGGVTNVQDIYSLTPLQHGILFHHMMAGRGDTYVIVARLQFTDRIALDRYASALQQVIERHDVLRTAFVWEDLNEPAQIVWRQVPSLLTEISLDEKDGLVLEQLENRFTLDHYKLDLKQASLLRLIVSPASDGSWVALQLMHHIIGDNVTLERMIAEVHTIAKGESELLATPIPFRNVVAQARQVSHSDAHTEFFNEMLADVDSPTLPFGLNDILDDGTEVKDAYLKLPQTLTDELKAHARRLQISLASLCHLAYGQVLACTSMCEKVVFGTVLLGRFQAGEGDNSAVGLLINTLPLRLNMDMDTTVEAAACQIHTRLSALLTHEHTSLSMAQRCSGIPADIPLFSALLNYRHIQKIEAIDMSFPGMTILGSEGRTHYPLTLSIDDDQNDHSLSITAQVASPISATRICAYMQQTLISMADALKRTPQKPVRSLTVVPPEERDMLLNDWNRTEASYPTDCCLHQLFEKQVTKYGNLIAVECEGETLTYAALNARANRLAHYLIKQGVRPDTLVGLCMSRSTSLLVAILGILKAGGAYVPLDPNYTSQRLIHILEDADPLCLLVDSAGQNALGAHEVPVVDVDNALSFNTSDQNPDTAKLKLSLNHLAYVIYTSGSTGTPKGAMIEHRSVVNYARAISSLFHFDSESHVLQFASCSFDASVSEIVMAWNKGARLCIPTEEDRRSDIALLDYMTTHDITHAFLPPAIFRHAQDLTALRNLKTLFFGGETPSASLLQNAVAFTTVFNAYGPTETTIVTNFWQCPIDFNSHSIPIGRPIANARLYILDSQGEPVPLGAEGELYIGGDGIARGYLKRPELTAERFLPDPFSDRLGARMYRTGDVVRYRPDGNVIYLGRCDQQVKIRGYRIEPGEIAARLVEHPLVNEALVVPRGDGSDTRLIAYVVAEPDASLARVLRTYLASLLPDYMVPAAYVCLPNVPLTRNGKLDYRALPPPDDAAFASQSYEAPQGNMEKKLAAIWRELLGVERISRHDNFFELGGHSLLAMKLANHVELHNIHIDTRGIFSFPILKDLAEQISRNFSKIYWDAAIPVRRSGDQPPIFCVPDGTGGTGYAFEIANVIDKKYPVYVLPWPSPEKQQPQSIEELASTMTPLIKRVRSNGPCAVIGYSAGGLLAYEIARQLMEDRYSVAFLGLLDTYPPPKTTYLADTDLFWMSLAFKSSSIRTPDPQWWERVKSLKLNEALEEAKGVVKDIKDVDIESQSLVSKQSHHFLSISAAYQVQSIPLEVHLFKAKNSIVPYKDNECVYRHVENSIPDDLRSNRVDPRLGWGKCNLTADFQVISIEGDHMSMIADPNNRTALGREITHFLNASIRVVDKN